MTVAKAAARGLSHHGCPAVLVAQQPGEAPQSLGCRDLAVGTEAKARRLSDRDRAGEVGAAPDLAATPLVLP